ncbi:hypothetical protein D3093_26880 (plasmid) [Azospirillum argentinense]|uniref:DUF3168 domain-containing protein n=1 Tax=Azospirillum argentinense TaxID=2970906 RepID=A0A4D8PL00_9PROT|nr:hypothetical protein [Azospirillum argentinense]QCN98912.1 hypothetical protein D3093_26880 [Azospirillum argentinense]
MIRRASIVARLKNEARALKLVEGVAELAALRQNPPLHLQPAAFVVPVSERPGENRAAGAVAQVNTVTFGVVLVMTNLADPRGEAAGDALELVRGEVRTALLGWRPDGASGACHYAGGETVEIDNKGALWWIDRYRVTESLRSV